MAKIKSSIRNELHQLCCPKCKKALYIETHSTRIVDYYLLPNPNFIKFVAKCGGCQEFVAWVRESKHMDGIRYTELELASDELWSFLPGLVMGGSTIDGTD